VLTGGSAFSVVAFAAEAPNALVTAFVAEESESPSPASCAARYAAPSALIWS
jgi:hypothetical protein